MDIKAVVLLSGGLDSVYNLYAACERWPSQVMALYFNYGQKALTQEQEAAKFFAADLKLDLQYIDITNVFTGGPSALTSAEVEIPTSEVNIDDFEVCKESAKKVWVPNRNGVFLNLAACVAEKLGASFIVPGFNKEEATTFPDNSVAFIEKINQSLAYSTSNQVQVHCFSQDMDKIQIAQECRRLGVDLQKLWSCYYSGENPCGRCESCLRFLRATR